MKIDNSTIKAIFTNLIFVIGVILTVIGFINGSNTVAKLVVFDVYPLNSYEENRCQNDYYRPAKPIVDETDENTISEEEMKKNEEICMQSLEKDRKLKLVEDITNSISFFVAGAVLSFSFRRFIFNK